MASIKTVANGYRAQVYVKGVRDSRCFRTKREASAWASVREMELRDQDSKSPGMRYTLGEALVKYRDEVSEDKRGKKWEALRINAFMRALPINSPIAEVTTDILGEWRRQRSAQVKAGTVIREISLLSSVFEEARREWKWIAVNPVSDMRKPAKPEHREVVLSRATIKAMLRSLGYSPRLPIKSITQACAVAFLIALRTGMRAGELCKVEWSLVFDDYCQVTHKTGQSKESLRSIPLSPKAMRLLNKMRGFDQKYVLGLKAQTLDTLFRRARDRARLDGFTFHDTRHTAATWLAQKLHILDLCKMFGWKGTKQAMTYYNPSPSDIAKRL